MTIIFCVAHSFATNSSQSQKHVKPAWSRLLTCTPWRTPSRPLPQCQEILEPGMQMEEYLCNCNKCSHILACLSRTWLRREPHARMIWLERPSRCRPISITRSKCNYRNNCNSSMKTTLQLMLHRRLWTLHKVIRRLLHFISSSPYTMSHHKPLT